MIGRFQNLENKITGLDTQINSNVKSIKILEKKLDKMEKKNTSLVNENSALREKVFELEYQQRHNNLIFEGVIDQDRETDTECLRKL